jgi:hypothetical protein
MIVVIWSLKADKEGRKHAFALLRVRRFQIRRAPDEG